ILDQLRSIGVSCDWKRCRFTLEEKLSQAVIQAFVTLHEQGYIYRGHRMVHWDPAGQTALADDEVIYREVQGHFYHINYRVAGEEETFVTVATTRPETLLGDTALCVHPDDRRYAHLIGKYAFVPLIDRKIPIIADAYVDPEMGTGCLKVTPAHDPNDYALSRTHDLPIIEIFHPDGTLSEAAQRYVGDDRFTARKKIVEDLQKEGNLVKKEAHTHQVGFSERTNAVIEPKLSTQWFVKMKALVKPALQSVAEGTIRFYPAKFQNSYNAWLNNVRDWCISRQLWWGHRIPAYHLADGRYVIAATPAEALEKARKLKGDPTLAMEALQQDEDVLDTWFSSWLWPMSVFDGTIKPDNADFRYYYPTHDLVTGPDIIFFWIARMIMAGYAFTGKPPFRNVYFTGIVRDKQGRKMSKSLGNSPDTLELIEKYGADGLRAGMLFSTPAGNDLLFDEQLCLQGKKFVHKLWSALHLVKSWKIADQGDDKEVASQWLRARYAAVLKEVERCFQDFRLSEAFVAVYKVIWDDFCAHYLEMVKPAPQQDNSVTKATYEATVHHFEQLLKLLHPFMPFITEEIWHQLRDRTPEESLTIASWSTQEADRADDSLLNAATHAFDLLTRIRHLRRTHAHPAKQPLSLTTQGPLPTWLTPFAFYIKQRGNVGQIRPDDKGNDQGIAFVVNKCEFRLPEINPQQAASRQDLHKDLAHQRAFLSAIQKKLDNPKFVAHASETVVARERKKLQDTKERIQALEQLLQND
ncbi:MAG: valine--tRNA ligase, partial [Bacteroidota bacterium]